MSEASTVTGNKSLEPCRPAAQVAEVVEDGAKWGWLQARLPAFIDAGDVLVFAATKARVDELAAQLQAAGVKCASSCLPVPVRAACTC